METESTLKRERTWKVPAILATLVLFVSVVVASWPSAVPNEWAVGLSKQQIREDFGEPDQVHLLGPLVVFLFDAKQRLTNIAASPSADREKTKPMDYRAFESAAPDDQHQMLMHLVYEADFSILPTELKSPEDVKSRLPTISFAERWCYSPTLFQPGAILGFDEAGVCHAWMASTQDR